MKKIIRNMVECKQCGEVIVSLPQNPYRTCCCGAVTIDGGTEYPSRLGKEEDYIELSIIATVFPEGYILADQDEVLLEWSVHCTHCDEKIKVNADKKFQRCSCGRITIDDGMLYAKGKFTQTSIWEARKKEY